MTPGELRLPDLIVESITVDPGGVVKLVIKDIGKAPAVNCFWVDAYTDPTAPPTGANQTWPMLASQGLVWGVGQEVLPLYPGDTVTLTVGDRFYWSTYSRLDRLDPGASIYAQADSWNASTTHGTVWEIHEATHRAYNNITGPVPALAVPERGRAPTEDEPMPVLGQLPPRPWAMNGSKP